MRENIQEVFWLSSADYQQLLYVSPAFETIWGYPRESLHTHPNGHQNWIVNSIHPDDRERVVAALATQLQQEYRAEYRIVRADGSIRWVRSRSFPVQNPLGETWAIAGLSEDITERKRSEETLRQREQEFRALVEHSPDLIFRLNRHLRYIYVNPAIERERGKQPEEFLGKSIYETGMPKDVIALWEQSALHIFQAGQEDEIEFNVLTLKGSKYYQVRLAPELAADGSVECLLGICRDITKRKQTEDALLESEERFRTVFESALTGIAIVNPEMILSQTNCAFEKFIGYTPEELQNFTLIQLTHPDDTQENIKLFEELHSKVRTHFRTEKRYLCKDGRLVWGDMSVSAIYDTNGLFQYAIAMIQDVSDQKQTELELFKARDELEQRVRERTAELAQVNLRLQQEIAERASVQEALKESHEFLQTLVDNNPNAIFVINREGKYVLVNQTYAECHGTTVEDVLGRTRAEIHPNQADLEHYIAQDQEVFTTLQPQFILEDPVHSFTGENRWYQTIKKPLFSSDGQVCQILGVSTDITERKLAIEALTEQKEFLQMIIDTNPNKIFVKDREGKYVLANRACADFHAVTVKDLLGRTDAQLDLNPADVELFTAQDREVMTTLQPKIIPEISCSTKTGERRWYQVIKQPLVSKDSQNCQVFGVCTDITERKFAEEQLRQREEQLRLALDAANMGFWDWNLQTGEVIRSQSLKRLFGWLSNPTDNTHDAFLARVHPDDRNLVSQAEQRSIENREDYHVEFRIVMPDRSIRWIEAKGQVIYDRSGKPTRLMGIDVDISERKLAETKIKESLQEKEVLLQEIHHRVKNNLQVISSLLDLQSQHIQNQTMLEIFRESQSRIRTMALVHEKLYQSKDCAKINFADYVETLTSYLFQVYGINAENIDLKLNIADVSLNINTAIPCGLIINELISNSLKYAFKNRDRGLINISFRLDYGNYWKLIVRDDGIGLPNDFVLNNVKSLGLQLVNVLTKQLEANIEFNHKNGTEISIAFSKNKTLDN